MTVAFAEWYAHAVQQLRAEFRRTSRELFTPVHAAERAAQAEFELTPEWATYDAISAAYAEGPPFGVPWPAWRRQHEAGVNRAWQVMRRAYAITPLARTAARLRAECDDAIQAAWLTCQAAEQKIWDARGEQS